MPGAATSHAAAVVRGPCCGPVQCGQQSAPAVARAVQTRSSRRGATRQRMSRPPRRAPPVACCWPRSLKVDNRGTMQPRPYLQPPLQRRLPTSRCLRCRLLLRACKVPATWPRAGCQRSEPPCPAAQPHPACPGTCAFLSPAAEGGAPQSLSPLVSTVLALLGMDQDSGALPARLPSCTFHLALAMVLPALPSSWHACWPAGPAAKPFRLRCARWAGVSAPECLGR